MAFLFNVFGGSGSSQLRGADDPDTPPPGPHTPHPPPTIVDERRAGYHVPYYEDEDSASETSEPAEGQRTISYGMTEEELKAEAPPTPERPPFSYGITDADVEAPPTPDAASPELPDYVSPSPDNMVAVAPRRSVSRSPPRPRTTPPRRVHGRPTASELNDTPPMGSRRLSNAPRRSVADSIDHDAGRPRRPRGAPLPRTPPPRWPLPNGHFPRGPRRSTSNSPNGNGARRRGSRSPALGDDDPFGPDDPCAEIRSERDGYEELASQLLDEKEDLRDQLNEVLAAAEPRETRLAELQRAYDALGNDDDPCREIREERDRLRTRVELLEDQLEQADTLAQEREEEHIAGLEAANRDLQGQLAATRQELRQERQGARDRALDALDAHEHIHRLLENIADLQREVDAAREQPEDDPCREVRQQLADAIARNQDLTAQLAAANNQAQHVQEHTAALDAIVANLQARIAAVAEDPRRSPRVVVPPPPQELLDLPTMPDPSPPPSPPRGPRTRGRVRPGLRSPLPGSAPKGVQKKSRKGGRK